ncbi:MAG: hypothetical protein ISS91_02205 [Candidatus Omnitrophica bacterium]|nr:hypothetical protein [Candidatus Omnitrophota bacterium]
MKKTGLFLLCFLVLFPGISRSESRTEITAEARVDQESFRIGDSIRYSVKVVANPDLEIEYPAIGKEIGDFEIKDAGRSDKEAKGKRYIETWYILRTFKTGARTIPLVTIKYKTPGETGLRSIDTNPVTVNVESVYEKSPDKSDIRDIKGIFYVTRRLVIPLGLIIALIVIALLVGGIYLKKRLTSLMIPEVIKLPHEIAFKRLEELKNKGLVEKGLVKEFYFELSDILRRYIEDRFNLRAPEMTTEEFLIFLKSSKSLSVDHKYLLREFLSHCDLVKFAKYGPSPKEIEKSLLSAESFVDQTKEEKEEKKNGI